MNNLETINLIVKNIIIPKNMILSDKINYCSDTIDKILNEIEYNPSRNLIKILAIERLLMQQTGNKEP